MPRLDCLGNCVERRRFGNPRRLALYWTGGYPHPNAGNATASGTTASFSLSGGVIGDSEGQFYAGNGAYFWSPIGGSMTCTRTLPIDCTTCSGGFSLSLYATSGAIEGTLEVIPKPQSLAGYSIWAAPETGGSSTTTTDATGHFEWRDDRAGSIEQLGNWRRSSLQPVAA